MADKIKELEAELAKLKAENKGHTLVVFEGEELTEETVELKALTDESKAEIVSAIGRLAKNVDKIQDLKLDAENIGEWLMFMELTDEPMQTILGAGFGVEPQKVATIPNLELLSLVAEQVGTEQTTQKANKLAKELSYITDKAKDK